MTDQTSSCIELERAWEESPNLIKDFIEIRPQYEQLCSEVSYILKKALSETNIEYSTISHRTKTLKNFIEKVGRKEYKDPIKEIIDVAGIRIVYLYKRDRFSIERLIESEFKIIKKIDKVKEQGFDRFGYGALHYLAALGEKSSGARYDDLKGLICEIQVRTVLQDAWAIIDHHLSYKQESEVPRILIRKLRALSGLFETADDQFDILKSERDTYRQSVERKIPDLKEFERQQIDFDSLPVFLKKTFPDLSPARDDNHISVVLKSIKEYGYRTFGELNSILSKTERARIALSKEHPAPFGIAEVAWAMGFLNPEIRKRMPTVKYSFEKFESLIEK